MSDAGEVREVRMDGCAVIAQLASMRAMADAMSVTCTALLIALGAEPEQPVITRPEEVTGPPRFGR